MSKGRAGSHGRRSHLLCKDVQGIMVARSLRLQLVLLLVLAVSHCRVICIRCQRALQPVQHISLHKKDKNVKVLPDDTYTASHTSGLCLWNPLDILSCVSATDDHSEDAL